jgi:hypothetical protein
MNNNAVLTLRLHIVSYYRAQLLKRRHVSVIKLVRVWYVFSVTRTYIGNLRSLTCLPLS